MTTLPQRRKVRPLRRYKQGAGVHRKIRYAAWAVVLACGQAAAAEPDASASARVEAFAQWARSHAAAAQAATADDLARGAALAEDRRVAMAELIRTDPARAYTLP